MVKNLESTSEIFEATRCARISQFTGRVATRFNNWRYGQRFTSERLAQDIKLLELARRELAVSSPTVAANLSKLSTDYIAGIVARGNEELLEVSIDAPENSAPQTSPDGTRMIFRNN